MRFTKIYTKDDGKSYFKEEDSGPASREEPIGMSSHPKPALGLIFRDFEKGEFLDWHNAPRLQYIAYLEGQVEVVASGGEKRVFKPGDILLAADLTGEGHTTRTLSKGRALIIPTT